MDSRYEWLIKKTLEKEDILHRKARRCFYVVGNKIKSRKVQEINTIHIRSWRTLSYIEYKHNKPFWSNNEFQDMNVNLKHFAYGIDSKHPLKPKVLRRIRRVKVHISKLDEFNGFKNKTEFYYVRSQNNKNPFAIGYIDNLGIVSSWQQNGTMFGSINSKWNNGVTVNFKI